MDVTDDCRVAGGEMAGLIDGDKIHRQFPLKDLVKAGHV